MHSALSRLQAASLASPALLRPPTGHDHEEAMKPHGVAPSLAMEGLERDFQSLRSAGTFAGLAGSSDEFAMLPFRKLSSFRSSERIAL